jgi:3-phenylpropionate/trans-cinnamate dioxygenase ferredoxin subunit
MSSGGEFEDAASVHQIRDGGIFFVEIGELDILLYRKGERIVALGANCTHAFSSLREGRVEGGVITCARHGARFDLASGRSISGNCPNLPTYQVKIAGERVLVRPR